MFGPACTSFWHCGAAHNNEECGRGLIRVIRADGERLCEAQDYPFRSLRDSVFATEVEAESQSSALGVLVSASISGCAALAAAR